MAKSAEFILDYELKQVLVLEPFGPYYDTAIQRLSEQPDLQIVECASPGELSVLGRQVGVCLILAHCNGESEAPEIVQMLEFLRPEIRKRLIRVVITVSRDYVFLLPKLIREGANEVVQQPISPKQLYLKLDRYLDILPSRDRDGNIIPPVSRKKGSGEDLSDEPRITWQIPLDLQSDFWTTVQGRTRWLAGPQKWAVTLIGPPPQFGEWERCEPLPDDSTEGATTEPTWQWEPKPEQQELFVKEEGTWKFRGEKPEYQDGAWTFQGKHPKLAFVQPELKEASKVEGDEENLSIAEDSEQARAAAELIEQLLKTLAPDYIERNFYDEEATRGSGALLKLNPLCAAYLVSEMLMSRMYTPERIVAKLAEYLRLACGKGEVEIRLANALSGLEAAEDGKVFRGADFRAVLVSKDGRRLGAIVAQAGPADQFSDRELEGFAKVLPAALGAIQAA